jgi:diguanylate cyclase (GGDEF)-like protein
MYFQPSKRELTPSEMVIHRLYEITSAYSDGFDKQAQDLLRLGLDRFQLDIGIIARIRDLRYEIRAAVAPPGVELNPGDVFPLGNTYCSLAVNADGPIGFERAGHSTFASHPAYGVFRLEAYLGLPLYVGGKFYGTLNFSSPHPRERKFTDLDLHCLRLMGGWVSSELDRRQTEEDLRLARQRLELLVRIDPLTELLNRRGIREALEGYSRRIRRDGAQLSCVLIDIDDFKSINDRFGHSMGDSCIRAVAQAVRGSLRPSDVAGRIGGDEFVAILPGASLPEARAIAERIGKRVRELPRRDDSSPFGVTVSIGVARVPFVEGASLKDLLALTEGLLRQSKKSGKNAVTAELQAV